ncbi:hypothetical protein GCM10023223_37040 [Stackebrandtia albiflava]
MPTISACRKVTRIARAGGVSGAPSTLETDRSTHHSVVTIREDDGYPPRELLLTHWLTCNFSVSENDVAGHGRVTLDTAKGVSIL